MANLFRVADESEGTTDPVGKVKMGVPVLSDIQQTQLQEIKDEFPDVVTTELGMAKHDVNEIDTGESKPIRSVPYRIALWLQSRAEGRNSVANQVPASWYHQKAHGLSQWCRYVRRRPIPLDSV